MALKSQLASKQTKKNIRTWSEAFKKVQDDALKEMASNLKNRLSGDELTNSFENCKFPITYIKGAKSRVSLPEELLAVVRRSNHKTLENCGHFPMVDAPNSLASLFTEPLGDIS